MKKIQLLMIIATAALFAACATMAPNELVNARMAFRNASAGPAAQLAPAELHKAEQALNLAEQSFLSEPESYKTLDLAYVAQRKSELAAAIGYMASDKASKNQSDADYKKKQTEIVTQGKKDLAESEKRTADADKRTIESEKRTAAALAKLAKLAEVKEEKRGLVIALSGSVLFRSSKSTLLPSARVKLDQVCKALLSVPARNLIVEGNTDSKGTESYNQALSQRRAEAVRDYLVQAGYPSDKIQARGRGLGSPIADNASPEGRANNRRVEIIVEREQHSSIK
jgi:outer membrane protein OmpA-like peptidoglycan-associated protein